jgi:hypothetical protein
MHKDAIINKIAHIRFWHTPERCKEKENLVLIKKQLNTNPSFNTFWGNKGLTHPKLHQFSLYHETMQQ